MVLSEIQDKMRNACIKSYNKFYDVDSRLKTKQKGRNKDINVNKIGKIVRNAIKQAGRNYARRFAYT